MNYILGIDQGATKTLAALADLQGNILAYGSAPGGYHAVSGLDHAVMQIRTAAEKSIRKANVEKSTLVYVGAGMTAIASWKSVSSSFSWVSMTFTPFCSSTFMNLL